jgi:CDK-activating kinase assembly factor MAT1
MPADNAFSLIVLTFSLNRREDEFDSKRAWDDFLEIREEMVMNLVLKTDVKKTEAALNRYKEANMDIIRANAALERKEYTAFQQRPMSAAAVGVSTVSADAEGPLSDPSGLVKGLRRAHAPVPEKAYEPFMGMATSRDYYELRDNYPSIRLAKAKKDDRTKAGGFDFQAYFDESLLRAFAGLGCFIDEEKAGQHQPSSGDLAKAVVAEA